MSDGPVKREEAEVLLSRMSTEEHRPKDVYKALIEERNVNKLCGYVCCGSPPAGKKQSMFSTDPTRRPDKFCGSVCEQSSNSVHRQLGRHRFIRLPMLYDLVGEFSRLTTATATPIESDFARLAIVGNWLGRREI